MFKKIIFLESEIFYKDILDPKVFSNVEIYFDGAKNYKKNKYFNDFDVVVYTIYSSPLYNMIILNCKKEKIPTMLLMDGICEFSNFTKNKNINKLGLDNYHPIFSDYLYVIGERAQKYFSGYGISTFKFLPPRIMQRDYKDTCMDKNLRREKNIGAFLLTTANTAYYDVEEFEHLCRVIKKVVSILEERNLPYFFRVFDEKIIKEINIEEGKNYANGSFDEVIKKVDYVITTPSSIMLKAMQANKPVATLLYRDSPNFIQSGWLISEGLDVSVTIESMLSRDEKRMNFQQAEIKSAESYDAITSIEPEKFNRNSDNYTDFINQNMFNMLNSKFNFNFEYLCRKLYWKLKGVNLVKMLRKKIMH